MINRFSVVAPSLRWKFLRNSRACCSPFFTSKTTPVNIQFPCTSRRKKLQHQLSKRTYSITTPIAKTACRHDLAGPWCRHLKPCLQSPLTFDRFFLRGLAPGVRWLPPIPAMGIVLAKREEVRLMCWSVADGSWAELLNDDPFCFKVSIMSVSVLFRSESLLIKPVHACVSVPWVSSKPKPRFVMICPHLLRSLLFFASWGAAAYLEKCRPDYIEDSLFSKTQAARGAWVTRISLRQRTMCS